MTLFLFAQLVLTWHGGAELCAPMTESVRERVVETLADAGVSADWGDHPEAIRIILVTAEPDHWDLSPDTLGVVLRGDDRPDTAYIFARRAFRVLGYPRPRSPHDCPSPRVMTHVARALARIIVHETVHVVAPDHPHADDGLLADELDRKQLVRRQVPVDSNCVRVFRDELRKRDRN